MGNLGWYQLITMLSKKVHGPKNLLAIVFGGGVLVGGGAFYGINEYTKARKRIQADLDSSIRKAKVYSVNKAGISNEGLQFNKGDQFKVLDTTEEIALIEKIGDEHNPYFVSLSFIRDISDYDQKLLQNNTRR